MSGLPLLGGGRDHFYRFLSTSPLKTFIVVLQSILHFCVQFANLKLGTINYLTHNTAPSLTNDYNLFAANHQPPHTFITKSWLTNVMAGNINYSRSTSSSDGESTGRASRRSMSSSRAPVKASCYIVNDRTISLEGFHYYTTGAGGVGW
jgi:hypothetical protein